MKTSDALPHGWSWVALGQITADTTNGFGKRRSDTGTPRIVLRLADIAGGEIRLDNPRRVNCSEEEIEKYRLQANDLLAIRVNGSPELVGRLVRSGDQSDSVLFCDHFIRVRLCVPEMAGFIRYYGETQPVRHFIDERKVSSAGQNTISQGTLEQLQVPLPPLNEQRHIVAKLDELFSDLDAGVAALERARANLKRYRAAVLKAAVEGRLTEQWRAAHPATEPASQLLERILAERRRKWEADQLAKYAAAGKTPPKDWQAKYVEPTPPDTANLPDLPHGWCWASVDQLAEVQGGIQKQPKRKPVNQGHPYLRVANVLRNRLDLSEVHRITLFGNELAKLRLEVDDLLVVEGNGSKTEIGRSALWNGAIPDCVHQNHIIRVRCKGWSPKYLNAYWNSPVGNGRIMNQAASTSGLYTLSVEKVSAIPVPLPPHQEQEQIVAEVEERLSVIDAAEAQIETNLQRAARLWQSILKHAFEGKLVPQDPNDEPASVLLERIKQQRASSANGEGGRINPRPMRKDPASPPERGK
jgi:type I restriction enzyme S subunit